MTPNFKNPLRMCGVAGEGAEQGGAREARGDGFTVHARPGKRPGEFGERGTRRGAQTQDFRSSMRDEKPHSKVKRQIRSPPVRGLAF